MTDIEYLEKYLAKDKFDEGIERLKKGEPVQYIVGNVDFYGYKIKVNNNVLIPRFETELLVEKTINYIKKYFNKHIDIVDIGCGSGCISIALKKELDCNTDAVDISLEALNLAKENAKINNVDINFYHGNMLDALNKKYDVIISNPPYISYDEEIEDIVKNNEPAIALFAEDNGLYFYKEMIKNSRPHLKEKFIIAFEIGCTQKEELIEFAKKYYNDAEILVEKDLSNRDRYLFIKKF